jgi:copper chaperone CopZ
MHLPIMRRSSFFELQATAEDRVPGTLDLPMLGSPTFTSRLTTEMTMLSLNVPKMSCSGCAANIEKAVKSVDHTATVKVDIAARRVDVDTRIDTARIAEAIKAAGYDFTTV